MSSARQSWAHGHPVLFAAVLTGGLLFTACGLLGVVGGAISADDDEPTSEDRRAGGAAGGNDGNDRGNNGDRDDKGDRKLREPAEPNPPATYLVVHVIDGDTVELDDGEHVRLVGIDAPEDGTCGAVRATEKLADLVEGRRVVLVQPVDDRDRYDRLLRYVDRGSMDAGLELIEAGLAIARYDSRDGYDAHPREGRYHAADRKAVNLDCAPAQPPPSPEPPKPRRFVDPPSGCEPGYSPCVPAYPPDVNCADTGPVRVTGSDPHGLDADGDGRACGGD